MHNLQRLFALLITSTFFACSPANPSWQPSRDMQPSIRDLKTADSVFANEDLEFNPVLCSPTTAIVPRPTTEVAAGTPVVEVRREKIVFPTVSDKGEPCPHVWVTEFSYRLNGTAVSKIPSFWLENGFGQILMEKYTGLKLQDGDAISALERPALYIDAGTVLQVSTFMIGSATQPNTDITLTPLFIEMIGVETGLTVSIVGGTPTSTTFK